MKELVGIAEKIAVKLIERKQTIAIAESSAGGLISAALLAVPGARFTVGQGGLGEKLNLILSSDDSAALKATALDLERQLRGVGRLSNVTTTASLERPEIIVRPDLQRAAERGVTTAAIGTTMPTHLIRLCNCARRRPRKPAGDIIVHLQGGRRARSKTRK